MTTRILKIMKKYREGANIIDREGDCRTQKIKEAIPIRTKRAIGDLPLFAINFSSIYIWQT